MNARSSLDLAGCEAEPIHVPGAIQPHGAPEEERRGGRLVRQTALRRQAAVK